MNTNKEKKLDFLKRYTNDVLAKDNLSFSEYASIFFISEKDLKMWWQDLCSTNFAKNEWFDGEKIDKMWYSKIEKALYITSNLNELK